jgi:hypothetical protein
MPKEITSFRVNFETAWLKMTDVNLQLLTQMSLHFIEITRNPVNFNIQCAGNVAYRFIHEWHYRNSK